MLVSTLPLPSPVPVPGLARLSPHICGTHIAFQISPALSFPSQYSNPECITHEKTHGFMLEHKPHNSHANAMTYAFLWFMQKPSVPCKNRQSMHFPRCAWIHGSTLMHGSMRFWHGSMRFRMGYATFRFIPVYMDSWSPRRVVWLMLEHGSMRFPMGYAIRVIGMK